MQPSQFDLKFKDLFEKLHLTIKQSTRNRAIYTKLEELVRSIIHQRMFISNSNLEPGSINLQPSTKKNLSSIIKDKNIQKSHNQQKIYIARIYSSIYAPEVDKTVQISKWLKEQFHLNISDNNDKVYVVYYRNSFYLLKDLDEKCKSIQKNLIVSSPLLDLSEYSRITIQARYYDGIFQDKAFTDLSKDSIDIKTLNFERLNNLKSGFIPEYREYLSNQKNSFQDTETQHNDIYEFNCLLISKIQQLICQWHDSSSDYRVGITTDYSSVAKHQPEIKPNYFIYTQFQQFQYSKSKKNFTVNLVQSAKLPLKSSLSSIDSIRYLKELLLSNMLYHKHKPMITKVFSIKQTLQTNLYNHLKDQTSQIQKQESNKILRLKQKNTFKKLQDLCISDLFKKWAHQVSKNSNKTPFLCINLKDMYLVAANYKYTRMTCEVCLSYGKKCIRTHVQTRQFLYEFDQEQKDWSVRLIMSPKKNQSHNIIFDISKMTDLINICVKIKPESGNSTKFVGSLTISKLQKRQSFGQNFELILQDDQSSSSSIVGFLNGSFLIKSHSDENIVKNIKISNFRKIKLLQNMGRIPPNYFQTTKIDYSPDKIALFGRLVSFKQLSISRRNFQLIYVELINLLQQQRMNKMRGKIVATDRINKSNISVGVDSRLFPSKSNPNPVQKQKESEENLHFFPHKRVKQYQRCLRIKLIQELKSQYKAGRYFFFSRNQTIQSKQKFEYQSSIQPIINNLEPESKNYKIQLILSADRLLLQTFLYFDLEAKEQLSSKTFALITQNVKKSMQYATQLYCPQIHSQTLSILSTIYSLRESNVCEYIVQIFKIYSQDLKNSNNESKAKNDSQKRAFHSTKKRIQMRKSQGNIRNMQAFNPFMVPLVNRIVTLSKQQRDETDDKTSIKSSGSHSDNKIPEINIKKVTEFALNFLTSLYPYFSTKAFQKQCHYIRYFVEKYLPQLNLGLNRSNIGLQNLISKYMLSLFSVDLEQEITFQIWDYLVLCQNKFAGRLNSMLTLLIFLEKTNFNPIIPINSFVNALYQNQQKFDFGYNSKKIADLMTQNLGKLFEKQHARKQTLFQMRDEKGNLLIGHQFFKKIMFDSQRNSKVNYVGNKKVNLNNLSYKLPQPKYYGHPVQEVKLLIKSVFIYDTVSISNWNLIVQWHDIETEKIVLGQKSQILNHYVKLEYPKALKENTFQLPHVRFILYPEKGGGNDKFFMGYLPIVSLHKDFVYSEQIRLIYFKNRQPQLTNKGQNILNVQFILKAKQPKREQTKDAKSSTNFAQSRSIRSQENIQATLNSVSLRLQKQYYLNEQKRLELLYDRLLDYDLNQDENQGIAEMKNMKNLFHKMKNPIDQFTQHKYQRLKVPSVGDITFPQVVMNSQLLIQHFQALIYQSFPNSNDYKTKVPDLYKIFSKHTNFQMVFLTEILIQAVLLDKTVSLEQRIQYLYCLGKHYQNCSGTGLTVQTVDFIFDYVYKIYGWLTGVPYSAQGKGDVVSGTIYTKGVKNTEDSLDITSILKDWAHISKIKFGNYALVLGDANYLTQLRALLPSATLEGLQNNHGNDGQLRIQIVYRKNGSQNIWSVTVDIRDFKIKSMGTKFLERFPIQRDLHAGSTVVHENQHCRKNLSFQARKCQRNCAKLDIDLDTSSQILYNCSNLICLQSSRTLDRQAFRRSVYQTPLLCYLLNYSSVYEPSKTSKQKFSHQISPQKIVQRQKYLSQTYQDWVLYRYQNCIQEWRRCSVENIQNGIAEVKFPKCSLQVQLQLISLIDKCYNIQIPQGLLLYKAPVFQIWSMEQNLLQDQSGELEEKQATSDRIDINKVQLESQTMRIIMAKEIYLQLLRRQKCKPNSS